MIDAPIHPFQDCSLHMTLEHVLPLCAGGTNDFANLALACYQCNQAKDRATDLTPSWAVA